MLHTEEAPKEPLFLCLDSRGCVVVSTKIISVTQSATSEGVEQNNQNTRSTYAVIACHGSARTLSRLHNLDSVETIYQIPTALCCSDNLDVHECVSNVIEGVLLTRRKRLTLGVAKVTNGVVDRVIEMKELRMFALAKGIGEPFGALCKVFELYERCMTQKLRYC